MMQNYGHLDLAPAFAKADGVLDVCLATNHTDLDQIAKYKQWSGFSSEQSLEALKSYRQYAGHTEVVALSFTIGILWCSLRGRPV